MKIVRYRTGGFGETRSTPHQRQYHPVARQLNFVEEEVDDEFYLPPDEYFDEEGEEIFALDNERDRSSTVCPKLLVHGRCWDRGCRFIHNPRVVDEEKKKLLQKWNHDSRGANQPTAQRAPPPPRRSATQTQYHGQNANVHKSLVQSQQTETQKTPVRHTFQQVDSRKVSPGEASSMNATPAGRQGAQKLRPGFNILEETDEVQSDQDLGTESECEDCTIISTFLRVDTGREYWAASHREATATVPGTGESTFVAVALFDTGASADNLCFMSMDQGQWSDFLPRRLSETCEGGKWGYSGDQKEDSSSN